MLDVKLLVLCCFGENERGREGERGGDRERRWGEGGREERREGGREEGGGRN